MIELKQNHMLFSFPEVHPDAKLEIDFQRTLRIPDDGRQHCLPPGLGSFPLRHVDDFAQSVPEDWMTRGGVMLPMYQAEALWICFHAHAYPMLVKVAAGKVNAVTGKAWADEPRRDPQDYMVVPGQPWLDGFCVEKDVVRQFVAMPLGSGYSAEEQITGKAEYGGLQVMVCPLRREAWERVCAERERLLDSMAQMDWRPRLRMGSLDQTSMGVAPGGKMRQQIYDDTFDLEDWDTGTRSRCFVHLANSPVWHSITGETPPHRPPTAKDYTAAGLPWFDDYNESAASVEGSKILAKIKSVFQLGLDKGEEPLPENEPVQPKHVVKLGQGRSSYQVREW